MVKNLNSYSYNKLDLTIPMTKFYIKYFYRSCLFYSPEVDLSKKEILLGVGEDLFKDNLSELVNGKNHD